MINMDVNELRPAPWRANYVLRPDVVLLERSILQHGWIYPIITLADGLIVDGHYRCAVAKQSKQIQARDGGVVPVVQVAGTEIDAMVIHVQLNRTHGSLQAVKLGAIIRTLEESLRYTPEDIVKLFNMTGDEYELLSSGGLLKVRKISEHSYSRAWVPIELAAGAKPDAIAVERPPNADR